MAAFIIYLTVLVVANTCNGKSVSNTSQNENGIAAEIEEINFEIDIPTCNETSSKSFVVDLHFSLNTETAPKLVGKLLQSCINDVEMDIKMGDIYQLIQLDHIALMDFTQLIKDLNISSSFNLNEFLTKYQVSLEYLLTTMTEIEFMILKHRVFNLTKELTFCDVLRFDKTFLLVFDEAWKASDAFSLTFLDIIQYDKIMQMLKAYHNKLNDIPISAVFVDSSSAVSNAVVYNKWIANNDYVNLFGITIENCARYEFSDVQWINSHIVTLKSKNVVENYIKYDVTDKEVLENCVYITKVDDLIHKITFETIKNQDVHLIAEHYDKSVFAVGSPLICNDTLYGLSEFYGYLGMVFASFQTDYMGSYGFTVEPQTILTVLLVAIINLL